MFRPSCHFLAVLAALAMPVLARATEELKTTKMISLDGTWLLATDPQNIGREQQWYQASRSDAKPAKVPWIIQDAFPGYHGVAWYWREFDGPVNSHSQGRTLLRFWAVDYLAEVWLNGMKVGGHEGGEGVFTLDVSEAIKPGQKNLLAVRVLNPTHEPIDGIALRFIPRRCKSIPFTSGVLFNDGGIVDSVELLSVPAAYLTDLHVVPNPKTGTIHIAAVVRNALPQGTKGSVAFAFAPAAGGETLQTLTLDRDLVPGDTLIEADVQVNQPRLWKLNDPYLYRVTAHVRLQGSTALHEQSTRCGFREFRFDDGYFRLNGQRIFLKCVHTATIYPVGLHWPHDPDLARRELIQMKMMGFNAIRFWCSMPTRYQLDLCDELGLMIYEENFAGGDMSDSPQLVERMDREVREMITRDRNHPSVVMWGLLNETPDGPYFRHAVDLLPQVRALDNTRVVMLNSGLVQSMSEGVCSMAGISMWTGPAATPPDITYNGDKSPIRALGVTWAPGQLALHPGPKGEYCVLRWTAPASGEYTVSAKFTGIAQAATTDVHILSQGRSLFHGFINVGGEGNESACQKMVSAKSGDTIDFVVGWGNGQYGGDSTAIAATIRAGDATLSDAASDFSIEKNPQGVWSYGYLQPGESPDASTFKLFANRRKPWGALSNPGSTVWENVLSDQHPYQRVPHTGATIHALRTISETYHRSYNGRQSTATVPTVNKGDKPVFISEYGVGSGIDLAKVTRQFEQLDAEGVEDARWYRQRLDQFMIDWKRWKLEDTFANPEDFFARCLAKMGRQRLLGLNAIRSNPEVIGYSMTGVTDCGDAGEGVVTLFRDLKPGTVDAIVDGWSPLRWCLFAEPVNVYRKTPVRLEAVLANEDRLKPGEYPVRLQVVGPEGQCVFDRAIRVAIPDPHAKPEPPMALPIFADDVVIDGPPGKYRFLVTFERGAAAAGGEAEFHVADPAEMPKVETEVVLWGEDAGLVQWLKSRGIRSKPFSSTIPKNREVILAAGAPPSPGGAAVFRELARRIARGSTVVFLTPWVFMKDSQPVAFVPLAKKGAIPGLPSWLYHKDEWTKKHPIFDGLPAGGLMDYLFYRDVISENAWVGQDVPAEIVAGATNTSQDYSAGLTISVNTLGAGRFILNTLLIRENLNNNPVADRLLINMLRYAARDVTQPLADLPDDFEAQMQAMGY